MSVELKRLQEKHWRYVDQMCDLLQSADAYKALKALRKVLREREQYKGYVDEVVNTLGLDNIGNALKQIRATGIGRVVLLLPPPLLKIPEIWLTGRTNNGKDKGFAKMSLRTCQREYRFLQPLLEAAWELIEQQPEDERDCLKQELLDKYEKFSPMEMSRDCYSFLNDYDLEEIVEEADLKPRKIDKDPSISEMFNALKATTISANDYGVQSKSEG